jgi:hypothetical protein
MLMKKLGHIEIRPKFGAPTIVCQKVSNPEMDVGGLIARKSHTIQLVVMHADAAKQQMTTAKPTLSLTQIDAD